jgi:hypothetical protein
MDWLESGVFFAVRADGCTRNIGYSSRNGVFSAVRDDVISRTVSSECSAFEYS